MQKRRLKDLKRKFMAMKTSGQLRNILLFIVFVGIAAVFWFIMALNDDVQDSFDIGIKIENVPDSVTFITDPPSGIHVTVRDKGTTLMRSAAFQHPVLNIDFKTFAANGKFRYKKTELTAALKQLFGGNATISSVSIDSISCSYTTSPGRKVPVKLDYRVTVASGTILLNAETNTRFVYVYGIGTSADTVRMVYTEPIVLRNLEESKTIFAKIRPIPGLRIKPAEIKVTFNVDPLVKKESEITVTPDYVPSGREILFFPAKVKMVYYVPMSRFNEPDEGITVQASFAAAEESHTDRVGVRIRHLPPHVRNASLLVDSVEYTIVKL